MSTIPQTQITLPTDTVEQLSKQAKLMGLDLPAYLIYLTREVEHKHDTAFREAVQFTFSHYSNALRTLAQ